MKESDHFKFSNAVVLAPMLAVLSVWIVFWIEVRFGVNFNDYGVYPRRLSGLRGVVLSPFIHGSVEHLYNNTIPLAVLTGLLFYFYRQTAFKTLLFGVLISGLVTWFIGRPAYHIGASGVIYVLAGFIFFKGVFAKHFRWAALSLAVVFIYGSMIWYIFPIEEGISWEGHLSGFLTGLLLALTTRVEIPVGKKYEWEKEGYNEEDDPFLKHFDADGNFIEIPPEETDDTVKVKYHCKIKDEE